MMPRGTGGACERVLFLGRCAPWGSDGTCAGLRGEALTVAVVMQVDELVAPLCDDSQRVFEEGDDDEEASEGWQIAVYAYMSASYAQVWHESEAASKR